MNNQFIILNDKNDSFFLAKQACESLGFKNYKNTIKNNVKKEDIFLLKDIVPNHEKLYKDLEGNTIFLNEGGFYALVFNSETKDAKKIQKWMVEEVLPNLRKTGKYTLTGLNKLAFGEPLLTEGYPQSTHSFKKQIKNKLKKIKELDKENAALKRMISQSKHQNGGSQKLKVFATPQSEGKYLNATKLEYSEFKAKYLNLKTLSYRI